MRPKFSRFPQVFATAALFLMATPAALADAEGFPANAVPAAPALSASVAAASAPSAFLANTNAAITPPNAAVPAPNAAAPATIAAATAVPVAPPHGASASAEKLFDIAGLPVTNSMLMMWIVAAGILLLARLLAGRPKAVPGRGQAIVEELLDGLRGMLAPIVGPKVIGAAFPLLVSFFLYILLMNWSGLLPGVGSIFLQPAATPPAAHAAHATDLFRPANADLNTTLALALISFGGWLYFVLRYAGLRALARETFGNKAARGDVSAPMFAALTVLFLAVGAIEVISILFRPVSLSFRLFGNVFGGENLLHQLGGIFPVLLPVAGYFLEVLVGLIQALVFTMLSAVYIGLVCNHDDAHAVADGHTALSDTKPTTDNPANTQPTP